MELEAVFFPCSVQQQRERRRKGERGEEGRDGEGMRYPSGSGGLEGRGEDGRERKHIQLQP